jgi:hypothetical protein
MFLITDMHLYAFEEQWRPYVLPSNTTLHFLITVLVTPCVGNAFENALLKGK